MGHIETLKGLQYVLWVRSWTSEVGFSIKKLFGTKMLSKISFKVII